MTDLEKKQIEDLRKQGNGYKKIAQLTGLSINTVKSFCRRIGTVSSSQCMQCGKEITQVKGRKEKKFCCDACRMKWWNSHQDQVKRKAVYAEQIWKEIEYHKVDYKEGISLDELEAVSGGWDRDYKTDGCAATVEGYTSWCGSNDRCDIWDVTYDNLPVPIRHHHHHG